MRIPTMAFLALAGAVRVGAQTKPAARIGAVDVSIADVDAQAGERLTKVRNEEYQIRRQVLDGLIEKRLIETETRVGDLPGFDRGGHGPSTGEGNPEASRTRDFGDEALAHGAGGTTE